MTGPLINTVLLLATQLIVSVAVIAVFLSLNGFPIGTSTNDITSAILTAPYVIIASALSMYAVWLGGMAYVAHRAKRLGSTGVEGEAQVAESIAGRWRQLFRLSFKKRDLFFGPLLAVGLILLLTLVTTVLAALGIDPGEGNGSTFLALETVWLYVIGIGIVSLLGPISEELFFRGWVLRAIQNTAGRVFPGVRRVGTVIAVLLSSIVFGLMHFQGGNSFGDWFTVIVTGSLGLVFALVTIFTRRLGPAILGHVFYNGITMAIAIISL